ncbi:DUF4184 family protein [Paenibacillus xanthanilyticus]|uniref:DUF4184 family protein n=1 Tax=Paenibacillus xanthanilyticus TaxID=1783531 RepID=A0ABV8K5V8_9BACL
MPFTFAHPAFALPIKRTAPRYLSTTGLVLGSMAPDFEYFANLEPHATIGHSVWGLLLHALPLSVLLAALFHLVVKKQLALHLPSVFALDRRAYRLLGPWKLNTLRAWIVFLCSVIIGFLTHVVLDAFTHQSGYTVLRWPLLQQPALFGLPLYKCLQHGLSLTGLLFLAFLTAAALRRAKTDQVSLPVVSSRRKARFWLMAVLVAAIVAAVKLIVSDSGNTLGILVVSPLSGFCLGLVVSSIVFGRRS